MQLSLNMVTPEIVRICPENTFEQVKITTSLNGLN